jgi:tryptophan synthase alpha chain
VNRIDERFRLLAEKGEPAFIPYIAAGDPSLAGTEQLVLELERAGADIIELGVPFSDPLADGIVNQEAAQRALKNGVSLRDVLNLVGKLRKVTQIPLVLFSYFNPVLAYGLAAFATDAADAGVDGVLCVDLPPEESEDYCRNMASRGVATIYLIAPTSTPDRVRMIAERSTGFIYYVSRTGVTGERNGLDESVRRMVAEIRKHTQKPVAVGFGISTPSQTAEVAGYADGVVVGSAIVRRIGEQINSPSLVADVGSFARALAAATKQKGRAAS